MKADLNNGIGYNEKLLLLSDSGSIFRHDPSKRRNNADGSIHVHIRFGTRIESTDGAMTNLI